MEFIITSTIHIEAKNKHEALQMLYNGQSEVGADLIRNAEISEANI